MDTPSLQPFSVQHYLDFAEVYEPCISPDGQWVAYIVHLHNTDADEQQNQVFVQSTSDQNTLFVISEAGALVQHPKWSADSQSVYFLAKAESKKDERLQVWKYNLSEAKRATQFTQIEQGVVGFACSPTDIDALLLIIKDQDESVDYAIAAKDRKPKPIVVDRLQFKRDFEGYLSRLRQHLYIYKPSLKQLTPCTFGDYDDYEPAFSPDGRTVVFASNRSQNPDGNFFSSLWTINIDVIDPTDFQLTQCTDDHRENSSPIWSPCGNEIAYITTDKEKAIWYATKHIATVNIATKQTEIHTLALDRNASHLHYSSDGRYLYFIAEHGLRKNLYSINKEAKSIEIILKGDYSVIDFIVGRDFLFPIVTTFNEPAELFKLSGDLLTKWSACNNKLLANLERTVVEELHYTAEDGTPLEGFILKPNNFDSTLKYPAILWIHGGPVLHFFYGYESSHTVEPTFFAANGYVVLIINPRGSSGYGQAFSEAIFADWGNVDYQDLLSGLDHVIDLGYIDEDRLGVGGWSYGGIQTNFMITKNTRFKAAISGASSALSRSNYGHDQYQLLWEKELGLPWENPKNYKNVSSFYDVANIQTPTLWIGCSEDWNVPIINTEQMYQAMKRLGKETQMVVYPGEHHIIQRPSFKKDRIERYLAWFNRFLKGN